MRTFAVSDRRSALTHSRHGTGWKKMRKAINRRIRSCHKWLDQPLPVKSRWRGADLRGGALAKARREQMPALTLGIEV
jgi:hypothetical protein